MIDGATAHDFTKQQSLCLSTGRDMVEFVLSDGQPRTLWEIQEAVERLPGGVHFSEATISARIRDLRKQKFGGRTIHRRSRGGQTYEYWLER